MHIFSHKTVQLFVRSLRGFIKSFLSLFPLIDCKQKTAVSILQTIALRCANIWFVLAKYMV